MTIAIIVIGIENMIDQSISGDQSFLAPSSSLGANSKMILSTLLTSSPLYPHHRRAAAWFIVLSRYPLCVPGWLAVCESLTLLFGAGWDLITGLNYCYYNSCFQLLFPCLGSAQISLIIVMWDSHTTGYSNNYLPHDHQRV